MLGLRGYDKDKLLEIIINDFEQYYKGVKEKDLEFVYGKKFLTVKYKNNK